MELSETTDPIENIEADAIIIGLYSDENDKGAIGRLPEALNSYQSLPEFSGKTQQVSVVYSFGNVRAKRVALAGLGEKVKTTHEEIRNVVSKAARKLRGLGAKMIVVEALHSDPQSTAEGIILGLYRFDELKSKDPDKRKEIDFMVFAGSTEEQVLWRIGVIISQAQNQARRLSEMPANIGTPTFFCDTAINLLSNVAHTEVIAHDISWAEEKKMGIFLSVTHGSDEPAKFLEIRYNGGKEGDPPLVFVGKGITFDTGGISLKSPTGMLAMRADCTGAAVVIGTLKAIADLQLKVNVVGLAPLTENMPSGKATKPTDVFFGSNGKSVEVADTDSEGRLVLSDALVYAESMKPHTIIDIATLTGAMMVALGKAYIGTYTRSDDLWDELNKAGAQRHERFWRMPLDPIYRKPFDSEIADLKNSGSRAGGANGAAMFLGEFVSKSFKRWAHLDIAGVMKADGKGYYPNGMTAMPVRALIQFVQNLTN